MKIDGYNPRPAQGPIQGSVQGPGERAATADRGVRDASALPGRSGDTDQVRLSSDVQVVKAATAAAAQAPALRQDVVDRMRALLNAGQIGNDPGRLADALIDSWIQTP